MHRTKLATTKKVGRFGRGSAPPRFSRRQIEVLARAVDDLQAARPDIFKFTGATRQTEWNLARHLSVKIHRYLRGLDCDVDLIKPDYGDQRPDIVFHRPKTHRSNFLVVEMKKDGTPRAIESDLDKIRSVMVHAAAAVSVRCRHQYPERPMQADHRP